MTVTATFQNKYFIGADQNLVSKKFLISLNGAYPSGGFTIDEDVLSSEANKFRKIYRAYFDQGSNVDENNLRYEVDSINNATEDDPVLKIKVYEVDTGNIEPTEKDQGEQVTGSFYLIIEGVEFEQVVPSQNE